MTQSDTTGAASGRAALPPPARILICSPIRIYAEGIALGLASVPRLEVVATVRDADACVTQAARLAPDAVLIDLATDAALRAMRALAAAAPHAKVVALGVPDEERSVLACAEAGVAAYVAREDSIEDLLAAVAGVARGEARCSPRFAAMLLRRVAGQAAAGGAGAAAGGASGGAEPVALGASGGAEPVAAAGGEPSPLTRREHEVLELVGEGLSNKQIAGRLSIELTTVKNHVHSILAKLGVDRRAQAVRWMQRRGV